MNWGTLYVFVAFRLGMGLLPAPIEEAIKKHDLTVGALLSGNRNFEGRIHPLVKTNWLASPPLVVAYALAGNMQVNLADEPLGQDKNGKDVLLTRVSRRQINKLFLSSIRYNI